MEWINIIKSRIAYFQSIHHSHEALILEEALNTIDRLVPPSDFEQSTPPSPDIDNLIEEVKRLNKIIQVKDKIIEAMNIRHDELKKEIKDLNNYINTIV